jgi:hypothetical protein
LDLPGSLLIIPLYLKIFNHAFKPDQTGWLLFLLPAKDAAVRMKQEEGEAF